MSLASRFLARVAPINIGDLTLTKIVNAVTAAGEVFETIARADATHSAWGKAMDPDVAPAVLLPWLAQFAGVQLLPGDTEEQQRYRIKQAAGFYQGTPRALVEELQLFLTGTRTVLLGFHTPDQWHYLVGVITSEAPSSLAVSQAIGRQNPAGMRWDEVFTSDWSSFVLAPDLIAHREIVDGEDSYVIGIPEYPTCQSVLDSFATCQDLLDNNPI